MKKILHILLTFLLLFNSCGFIFVYFQIRYTLHETAEYRAAHHTGPKEVLTYVLKINSELAHLASEGEFSIDGKMYDVIKIEVAVNEVIVYCINDHHEEVLNRIFNDNFDDHSPVTARVKNILKILLIDGLLIQQRVEPQFFKPQIYLIINKVKPQDTFSKVLVPPPLSL